MQKYWVLLLMTFFSIVAIADEAAINKEFEKRLPGLKIEELKPLKDTGLYEGVVDGDILYFSADGKYVFQGDVIDLETRESLTEQRRVSLRKSILDSLDEKDMIVFEPKKADYTLTVFTDIDCGYCRKLHAEMEEYNALGIRIRYMSFPRGGIDSESYDKAVNVWCAKDRQKAMTMAKTGQDVETKTCENPVEKEYEIGQDLGVNGTPALFTESGHMLPGYVPPKRLKQILDQASDQS